jgi:hypothetical protein
MAKLIKMISDRLWRSKINTNPLIQKIPQAAKNIAMEEKVIRGL